MAEKAAFCWSITRIFCYNLYKMACCVQPPQAKAEFDLLCLGLDKAGKSSLLNCHLRDTSDTEPTTGFNIKDIHTEEAVLHVKELGGSHQIRPYWRRYFTDELHAIVFVVDASESDAERCQLAAAELKNVLTAESLSQLPLFVIGTHCDCHGAKGRDELLEMLHLPAGKFEGREGEVSVHLCRIDQRDTVEAALEQIAQTLLLADSITENESAE